MKEEFFIFHPDETPNENPDIKYHILMVEDDERKVLCGAGVNGKLRNYSSNGEPITLDWFNMNIAVDPDGIVCEKCAKILEKRLKNG